MKRLMLCFVLFFMLAVNCFAGNISTVPINFMGIEWGSTPQGVERTLVNAGYSPKSVPSGTEYLKTFFEGTLGSREITVMAVFDEKKLVRISAIIYTDEHNYRSVYDDTLEALTEKYGKPNMSFEFLSKPYDAKDLRTRNEVVAIKNGRGDIAAFFQNTVGESMLLEIDSDLDVVIRYDSKEYEAFIAKVKSKRNQIF